jgi:ribose transport system substrate-binding protein
MARKFMRHSPIALLALVAALAVGGCGDDDGDETAAVGAGALASSDASRAVTEARKPLSDFDGPREPPGEVPAGKELAVIFPLPAPLPQRAVAGVEEAAGAIGWRTRAIDGRGTPAGYVGAVEQAISRKVDGIVLVAMPVPLLQGQIEKAAGAGIPTTAILPALPDGDAEPQEFGLFDWVSADHAHQGRVLGQWVASDAPGGAKAIRLTSPEFPDLTRESEQFEAALKQAGDHHEVVETIESPVTDLFGGPQGVQRLAAALRKHRDLTHAFILSESWSQIWLQAKKLTGRTDVVGLGSDGDVSVPLVAKGEPLVMIGPDTLSYGWYAVDSMIRAFNDRPAIGGYTPRSQLVDTSNAKDVEGEGITAGYDFRAAWRTLWGV